MGGPPFAEAALMRHWLLLLVLLALAAPLAGCTDASDSESDDLIGNASGPVAKKNTPFEVWSADNAWSDKDTAAAKKAGVAWGESSGLTWEEKFDAWVASFEAVPSESGGTTISIPTPFGDKKLRGPTLECAEFGMLMRATFASWYHLPFYLRGWDSTNKRTMYAGHFGFVDADGNGLPGFPRFRDQYKSYEASWKPGDAWPSDPTLRVRRLGADDTVAFLTGPHGEEVGAGAYFDELYLNKRTGYFMRLLLLYFGSVNLADGSNMFPIQPEATRPGDILLERWQKEGIGHTIPVLHVSSPIEGKLAIDVATGSMPRRQPVFDDALGARGYFTMDATGGEGTAWDGTPYAKLGGGIRRWRTATKRNGRWYNDVASKDKAVAVDPTDLAAISARPAKFDQILVTGSVDEQKAALLAKIESSRAHLREHPASCSARETREHAFEGLYQLAPSLGMTQGEIDAEFRKLEDHVFGGLVYEQSKTCCWNSTTSKMAEIILDLAAEEQADAEAKQVCVAPTVFRFRADGYKLWQDHAAKMGRSADWLAWSEDEPCAQRNVAEDTLEAYAGTPFCPASSQ
jgi:hypothetical protein